jgi:tRNA (mo5U34)-methyltransferase
VNPNFSYVQDWNRKLRELGWWHSFEMPDGSLVEGVCSLEGLKRRLAQFPIPHDLTGKRVLDIGAWDGFFSFELEKRGADVVAIDCWDNERFRLMRSMLNSRVDYRIYDMYELTPATVGRFDIVIFFGVLYHLKHPLLALERICALTKDLACVDTFVSQDDDAAPRMEFYEYAELGGQTDNWVGPNIPCLLAFCRTAGFARVEFRGKLEHSACVACYRHWEPVGLNAPEAPPVHHVMHDRNFGINFRSQLDEYVGLAFVAPEASVNDVKPEVGGFGVRPISVTSIGSGFYQANFKLPPGLDPGWHDVTLRLGDSDRSAPHRIAVDMPVSVEKLEIMSVLENETWVQNSVESGKTVAIWIEGLPDNVDVNNTHATLHGQALKVTHAGKGQVNATIPIDTMPGDYTLVIEVGGVTATAILTIQPPTS